MRRSNDESIDQPTNQPNKQASNQPSNQASKSNQITSKSKSINQSIHQSTNQSTNQSINQATNQSTSQPVNQSFSHSLTQSINQSSIIFFLIIIIIIIKSIIGFCWKLVEVRRCLKTGKTHDCPIEKAGEQTVDVLPDEKSLGKLHPQVPRKRPTFMSVSQGIQALHLSTLKLNCICIFFIYMYIRYTDATDIPTKSY